MSKIFAKFGLWFRKVETKLNNIARHLVAPSAKERYAMRDKQSYES